MELPISQPPESAPSSITNQRIYLVARAILFSLVINAYSLWNFFRFGGYSTLSLSDWDEPFYLVLAREIGLLTIGEIAADFPALPSSVRYRSFLYPHGAVDIVFGNLLELTGTAPVSLAVMLDFVVAAACFLIFRRFFLLLTKNSVAAELASFCMLAVPWLSAVSSFAHIPLSVGRVLTFPTVPYVCLPISRGLYTQLSYLFFGWSLVLLGESINGKSERARLKGAFAGVVAGMLIYVYFYAWVSMSAVGVLFLLFRHYADRKPGGFGALVRFGAANAAVSLGGVYLFLTESFHDTLPIPREAFNYAVVFPEQLIFLVIVVFALRRTSIGSAIRLPLTVAAATLTAAATVPNIQMLLKAPIQSYHFSLFYFEPLLTGCIIAAIFAARLSPFVRTVSGSVLVLVGLATLLVKESRQQDTAYAEDLAALGVMLDEVHPDGATLAVIPFFDPFKGGDNYIHARLLPFWIDALTRSKAVFPERGVPGDYSAIQAELALGVIFTGEATTVGGCPDENIPLPGDLLWGPSTAYRFGRLEYCRKLQEMTPPPGCESVKILNPTYVLWEPEFNLPPPPTRNPAAVPEWTSPHGNFELYKSSDFLAPCPPGGTLF